MISHRDENLFREVTENARYVFWVFDWEGQNVLYVSPAYETVWGRPAALLLQDFEEWKRSIHPADLDFAERSLAKATSTGGGERRDYRIVRPDGSIRWISDRAFAVRGQDGSVMHIVGIAEDITDRIELESRVMQSQKMEALGQLAGGLAHEFNNMLTSIQGNAELLQIAVAGNEGQAALADQILKASQRATTLTAQLVMYARRGPPPSDLVDLHAVIRTVVELLRRSIDPKISLVTRLNARKPQLHGDVAELQTALINLSLNARDAMPNGGTLTFETRTVQLDADFCRPLQIRPGEYVDFSLTDTGSGMDWDVQGRLFEPFFSTKGRKGTGMGLASVYNCVKRHEGSVQVYSNLGQGTTVRLQFPVAETQEKPAGKKPASKGIVKGKGRILVVDDEALVRRYVHNVLEHLGYTVTTCADGEEALQFFQLHAGEIDLVLLDLIMPKRSGQEVFYEMRKIKPAVKILICSGFSESDRAAKLLADGALGFIGKPFELGPFSQILMEALGQPRNAAG